jgi:hypothetical protein
MLTFSWDIKTQRVMYDYVAQNTITTLDLVLRDIYAAELIIVDRTSDRSTPYVVSDIPSGYSIAFNAKLPADLTADPALISQMGWVGEGTGTTRKYIADINLNTAALIAAMGTEASVTLRGEFVLIRPDNGHEASSQFSIRVAQDVYRGTEGTPVTVPNPIQQYTDTDGVKKVRLVNADGETCFVAAPL